MNAKVEKYVIPVCGQLSVVREEKEPSLSLLAGRVQEARPRLRVAADWVRVTMLKYATNPSPIDLPSLRLVGLLYSPHIHGENGDFGASHSTLSTPHSGVTTTENWETQNKNPPISTKLIPNRVYNNDEMLGYGVPP